MYSYCITAVRLFYCFIITIRLQCYCLLTTTILPLRHYHNDLLMYPATLGGLAAVPHLAKK